VLTGFRRPFTLQNLDALGHLNVPSERQFRLHVLAFGGARLFSHALPQHGTLRGLRFWEGQKPKREESSNDKCRNHQ
jgi:hypothetical protein